MSVVSLDVRPGNPVDEDTIRRLVAQISSGMEIKDPQDLKDYTTILAAFHESAQDVLAMADFTPPELLPDLERFPRQGIQFPINKEDNQYGAWASKCKIQDTNPNTDEGGKRLLEGKTIVLKDCISVANVPCTLGTDALSPPWVPFVDATVVKRVLEAGGIIIGKASTESMCQSASSFSSATGPVDNPYAPGYTTGGSSSGCAALVASGAADMAIGGDQGGSIRMPSSFCGLVGLKPTFGLVPYTGIVSNEWQHDYAGPMCKTVADAATLLEVIAGADGMDDRAGAGCPTPATLPQYSKLLSIPPSQHDGWTPEKPLTGLKIGLIKEGFNLPHTDPRVAQKVREAARVFEELGAVIEEISIPSHSLAPTIWMAANRCVGGRTRLGEQAGHRQYYHNDLHDRMFPLKQDVWEKLIPQTINSQINTLYAWQTAPSLYGKAMNQYFALKRAYDAFLTTPSFSRAPQKPGPYAALITPTIPFLANKHPLEGSTSLEKIMKSVGQGANCNPFNATGHPALTIPVGFLPSLEVNVVNGEAPEDRLPVGMQIIGGWYDEVGILRLGRAWESRRDWKQY